MAGSTARLTWCQGMSSTRDQRRFRSAASKKSRYRRYSPARTAGFSGCKALFISRSLKGDRLRSLLPGWGGEERTAYRGHAIPEDRVSVHRIRGILVVSTHFVDGLGTSWQSD